MPWWSYSLMGAAGVLAWQLASDFRAKQRNSEDRCAHCGERLEVTRFRFAGDAVCAQCADGLRQDLTWGAWAGFGSGALGILTAIGILFYYLVSGRPIEIVWIAVPMMFDLMFLWFVRSEVRSLRQQNRLAEQLEEMHRLEMRGELGSAIESQIALGRSRR